MKIKPHSGSKEVFYKFKIEKIEGESNELYSHAMLPKDHFKQFPIFLVTTNTRNHQAIHEIDRSSPDHVLHGSGRSLQRLSDGITFHMTKNGTGNVRCYVYLLSNAQFNILNGRFHSLEC